MKKGESHTGAHAGTSTHISLYVHVQISRRKYKELITMVTSEEGVSGKTDLLFPICALILIPFYNVQKFYQLRYYPFRAIN